ASTAGPTRVTPCSSSPTTSRRRSRSPTRCWCSPRGRDGSRRATRSRWRGRATWSRSASARNSRGSTNRSGRTSGMKSSRATRARRRSELLRLHAARAVLFAAILAGWEAAARTRLIDPYFVSLPSKLAATVAGWFASGFIYPHIWATIHEAVVGLAVGIVGGVVVGVLFAFSPFVSGLFHPIIVMFNAMPRIALAPLFIVWLGIGLASKVAMVVSL